MTQSSILNYALNRAVPIPFPIAQQPNPSYSPDVTLQLGPFIFQGPESPENINFGGAQMLAVHQLVGGDRTVDALGRNDDDITWKGLFFGTTASARAQYLDGLRIAGKALTLKWGKFRYQVVIKSFKPDFQQTYKTPYTIVCTPIKDETKPVKKLPPYQIKQQLQDQLNTATSLAGCIGGSALAGLMGDIQSAVSAIGGTVSGILGDVGLGSPGSLLNAAAGTLTSAETCVAQITTSVQGAIAGVLAPIEAAQVAVQGLLGQVNNAVSIFGMAASAVGLPGAQAAANIESSLANIANVGPLNRLSSVLGVMHSNAMMGAYGSFASSNDPGSPYYNVPLPNPATSITVGGGTLQDLAAQHYGDASLWPVIAQANGMTDPQISGVQTISIPQMPSNAAGLPPPTNTPSLPAPSSGWGTGIEAPAAFAQVGAPIAQVGAQSSGAINAIDSLFGSL